jgi:hypothetical protein
MIYEKYLWVNLLLFGVVELYASKKVFCLYRKRLFMQMYMKMKRVARRNKFIVQFPITVNKTKSLRAQQGRGVQTLLMRGAESRPTGCLLTGAHNKLMGPTMRVSCVDLHRLIARAL